MGSSGAGPLLFFREFADFAEIAQVVGEGFVPVAHVDAVLVEAGRREDGIIGTPGGARDR